MSCEAHKKLEISMLLVTCLVLKFTTSVSCTAEFEQLAEELLPSQDGYYLDSLNDVALSAGYVPFDANFCHTFCMVFFAQVFQKILSFDINILVCFCKK